MRKETKDIGDSVDYDKLFFMGGNKKYYSFENLKTLKKLIKDIHSKKVTIDWAEIKQNEFFKKIDELRAYPARGPKYIDLKKNVSKNIKIFYDRWKKIVYGFKKKILPLSKKADVKTDSGDQQPHILDTPEQKRFNDYLRQIKEE